MSKKVGVSYASTDRKQVDIMAEKLSKLGIELLRYETYISVQEDILGFMRNMIHLDNTFVILSGSYFKSPFCIYELAKLVEVPDKIIIVYLERDTSIETLLSAARKYWLNFSGVVVGWLESELKNIDIVGVLNSLEETLAKRYILYEELITSNGLRQIIEALNYIPEVYIQELEAILVKNDFYDRELSFIEYLKFAPANEVYYHYKALSYEKQGYIEGAVAYLRHAITQNGRYVPAYIKSIELFTKNGTKVELDDTFWKTFSTLSGIPEADVGLINKAKGLFLIQKAKNAKREYKRGLLANALEYFEKAISCSSENDATIYNSMGQVYEMMGEISLAKNAYNTAIEIEPRYYQALCNCALLYDKYFGEQEISRYLYEKCLEIRPDYAIAQSNYGLLMEKIDIEKALEIYFKLLCAPHVRTDFITNIALIFEEEKVSDYCAEILYRIMLEKKPELPSVNFNMGNYLRRKGRSFEEVIKYLGPVAQEMDNNEMVLLTMALLYLREKEFDKAIDYCTRALRVAPEYISAVFLYRYIQVIMKVDNEQLIQGLMCDIDKMEKIYQDSKNSSKALLYNLLSVLYIKGGNEELAFKWHQAASHADTRFEKVNVNNIYYGLDILEYEYPRASNGRIYKKQEVNMRLDDRIQILSHLQKILEF